MAYERTNWVCGDVVTADKLNNLEDGVEEALECCDKTPTPTAEDNGKVLGVANGKYALTEIEGDGASDGNVVLLNEKMKDSPYSMAYGGTTTPNFANTYPFIPIYEDVEVGDEWSICKRINDDYTWDGYTTESVSSGLSLLWMQNIITGAGLTHYFLIKLTDEIKQASKFYFGANELTEWGEAKAILCSQLPYNGGSGNNGSVDTPITLVKGKIY